MGGIPRNLQEVSLLNPAGPGGHRLGRLVKAFKGANWGQSLKRSAGWRRLASERARAQQTAVLERAYPSPLEGHHRPCSRIDTPKPADEVWGVVVAIGR